MQLLRLHPCAAPKRYIFEDPDTHRKFNASNKESLVRAIVAYRAANGLHPIKRLEIVLDHYWASLPENKENAQVAPPMKRGWLAYIKGGITLLDNLWYGPKRLVDQKTADERARQCSTCRFNHFPDKGPFVEWADKIAQASVGDLKTPYDEQLGNCAVCSCVNRAKVWYKGVFRPSDEEYKKFKLVDCWQTKPPFFKGR